jgi:DNA-binding response OmpR family regulator
MSSDRTQGAGNDPSDSRRRRRDDQPPATHRILVVEDEPAIAAGIVRGLRSARYEVELATDGLQAIRAIGANRPDLVVLDLNLPEASGFDVLERLRSHPGLPVVVVTARTGLDDRLRCFDLGAVDFLPKPFWIEELLARIRARLDLPQVAVAATVSWDDVVVDLDAREVTVGDVPAKVTPQEFEILAFLVSRPGRAVARGSLAELSQGPGEVSDERTVDSHVARIRRKLGPAGSRIATVWGIGYRFDRRED